MATTSSSRSSEPVSPISWPVMILSFVVLWVALSFASFVILLDSSDLQDPQPQPQPPLRLTLNVQSADPSTQTSSHSTITCWRSHPGTPFEVFTTCHANNVCYDPQTSRWLFFLPPKHTIFTYPDVFADIDILLSGLARLGTYESDPLISFSIVKDPPSVSTYSTRPTVLVSFLMTHPMWFHWVLDDLLGLFWTLQSHQLLEFPDLAVLNLHSTHHPWLGMIAQYFTRHHPVSSIPIISTRSCYRSLYFGPAHHHFGGPGRVQIKESLVRNFSQHFLPPTHPLEFHPPEKAFILVANRRNDRMILNFEELLASLTSSFSHRFTVIPFVFEDHDHEMQLAHLQHTTCLVSTHGSQLTNMIWLPYNTSLPVCVLEIFPYKFYRPTYKDLAALLNITYLQWKNHDLEKTRFHPDILTSRSLPDQAVRRIQTNPSSIFDSWDANLYWINQDTQVDTYAIQTLLAQHLAQSLT